jgi:hypothetical protein
MLTVWEVPKDRSIKGVERFMREADFEVTRGNDNLLYLDTRQAAVVAMLLGLQRVH